MRRIVWTSVVFACIMCLGMAMILLKAPDRKVASIAGYSGSGSCRDCHEKFYQLWSTSHHGLAMQPYTVQFAKRELQPQIEPVRVGPNEYRAVVDPNLAKSGFVLEQGPQGQKRYPIEHVMGGKDVYYLLTPMAKGRWQVLPVAYDVRRKVWYDTTASMVRHFQDRLDQAIDWKDPLLTFNTSCYNCHVSQLANHYDPNTDTFRTVWAEPGINCETCHGPSAEHVRVCRGAQGGQVPKDLKITTVTQKRGFSPDLVDSACAPCHAKMVPLTGGLEPGQRYFDQFDLTTFEDPDWYPDGRDLGENFTYALWLMSPCIKGGRLDCMYCHTSSGRYRFADRAVANNACMPCHKDYVDAPDEHTHHAQDEDGSPTCTSCHMPMTEFGRMRRSDHSLRPPMPAATIAFGSPNACNLCHKDKDAAWADQHVRSWRSRDYQGPVLRIGGLIMAARRGDWAGLLDMLDYIEDGKRDEIYANSLVRLLQGCPDQRKWPVLLRCLREDRSPLIRSSAATALADLRTPDVINALAAATQDSYRLVRIRAAEALSQVSAQAVPKQAQASLRKATDEYLAGLSARPHNWDAHFSLGNIAMSQGQLEQAVRSFQVALQLRPDNLAAWTNMALCENQLGRNDQAEKALRQAISLDANGVAAHQNLALLLGEMGRLSEAELEFRVVLNLDPNSAVAAYNLGVLVGQTRVQEAIVLCRKAYELRPSDSKYAYTYAFYLVRAGRVDQAVAALKPWVDRGADSASLYMLLAQIYERRGQSQDAMAVYKAAAANDRLPPEDRGAMEAMIRAR